MLPAEFIERIRTQQGIDLKLLIDALEQPSPVSLRINPGKWDHPVILSDQVAWEKQGYYLTGRPVYTLDPLFHAGIYYPQEASSMFTGEAFRQLTTGMDRKRILDLCAAPGGKSTHISSLLSQGDLLVANEVIRSRAAVLTENVTKWGYGNTIVTQNDPADFIALQGFFDVIIVDAPCSGEGMFRDEVARREWSPSNAQLCSERQRRILMDVWPALRNGGVLIYSTCTFNPAENEQNIKWLTENAKAETVALDISGFEGITPVDYQGITSYAFYPGKIKGDGFFLSAVRKTEGKDTPSFGKKNQGRAVLTPAPASVKSLMISQQENIFISGDRAISLACDQREHGFISSFLNVIKSGTMVGEIMHGKLIPAHDLAMSVKINREAWPAYEASYDEAISFLRMDEFIPQGTEQGRVLICYRGVPLGFVNHLGKRTNNGYPSGWRIRMEKRGIFEKIL